MNRTE